MQTTPHVTSLRRLARGLPALVTAVLVACLLSWTGSSPAQAAPGDGSASDPNIVYVGRWDTSAGTAAVLSWTGAYLQTAFTGTTVKVKARDAVNLYAQHRRRPRRLPRGRARHGEPHSPAAVRRRPHPAHLVPFR
ncbi:hypothetical protein [Streptomyces luteogriseus]|uniref:hypothetical protein n=1 Tax=Streptomyces luteogriseus TaxID=68233 RepID=UPI0037F981C6